MKKIFTLVIGIAFSITVLNAQEAPPQAFSFKATIQGANGQTVVNKMISLRITILQDNKNGFPVYSEFFTPTTNHYSQVDVEIGHGNVLSGSFSNIDWSSDEYFLKIEVDVKGGTKYIELSTTQLLSVPYALYAGSAGNAFSGNYDDLIGAPVLSLVATSGSYDDLFDTPTLFSGDYYDLTSLPTLFSGNYEDLLNKPTFFDGTWDALTGKPTFSNVAFSGSYADLLDKPVLFSGDFNDLTNKPALFSGNYDDLINKPISLSQFNNDVGFLTVEIDPIFSSHAANGITSGNIGDWNTAFGWGNHAGLYRPITYVPDWSEITSKPTFVAVATSGSYNDLTNKPTIDGSETNVTAGTNVTITGDGTEGSPYVINSAGESSSLTISEVLDFGNDADGGTIKNLASPIDIGDAATKAYVDILIEKLEALAERIVMLEGGNGEIEDIDGNLYDILRFGKQVWMAANLKTTRYNDGTDIPLVTDATEWEALTTPGYCFYNNDEATYKALYGPLYNWYAIDVTSNGGKNVCPVGWHVPNGAEWRLLTDFFGGTSFAGGELKESGTTHWNNPNEHATYPNENAISENNFKALPGGYRIGLPNDCRFRFVGERGVWWSSQAMSLDKARSFMMVNDGVGVDDYYYEKKFGFSVRCVKDQ